MVDGTHLIVEGPVMGNVIPPAMYRYIILILVYIPIHHIDIAVSTLYHQLYRYINIST